MLKLAEFIEGITLFMDGKVKQSLLIIDDENSNLKVLNHILSPEYTILTATNGIDGIERAKEYLPDLILLDVIMPGMDGYTTFTSIKECELIKNIPVVFISGLDSDEIYNGNNDNGLMLEAADFISKPFNASIVKLRVRNHLMHKSAVKNAENASRSKSVFLAKMSNEIRAQLNSILGISSNYFQNEKYPNEIKDAFSRIHNSGVLMRGIINDILDMSRIEAGKLELRIAQYNTADLINDTVLLNMIKYEKKPIEFFLNVDENVPSQFFGDENRIKQILNNLLSNAFKFTSSGEVELSVSADSDEEINKDGMTTLVLRVRDTGQGMMEEQISKLCEETPRFNTGSSSKNDSGGFGISILMELIKMMDGEIYAKSEPGCGTAFTVRLPQKTTGAAPLGKEAVGKLKKLCSNYEKKSDKTSLDSAPIPFGKILVVDDADINQYVIKEMLGFYGMEIDLASSGEEAIEKIMRQSFDLIFLDHFMPGMDGLETAKRIRKLESGGGYLNEDNRKHLPLIALTVNTADGVKERLLTGGFNDYLSKPVDLHELDVILKKWLNKSV